MTENYYASLYEADGDGGLTGADCPLGTAAFAQRMGAEEAATDDYDLCELLEGQDFSEYF